MFNESQKMAINHYLGPAMILAGPGSGKTTVITHRVVNLIQHYKVAPEHIMVVTFTKAAAINMRQRFLYLVNENETYSYIKSKAAAVTFGTFHSIFYKILKTTYNYREDSILGETDKINIIREIVVRLNVQTPSIEELVMELASEISKVKGNLINIDDHVCSCCESDVFCNAFKNYNRELKILGKLDFDDILIKCYELLNNNPRVLEYWQSVYSYILIDEFQDINIVQYEVIKLLAMPENNVFIVGDDDQSIYGFRGASPNIMKNFVLDFSQSKQILLNINYRCAKIIAQWAERLITHNSNRFEKNILAARKTKKSSQIRQFINQQQEFKYVAYKIKEYLKEGIKPYEIAILVRNNSSVNMICDMLEEEGIKSGSKSIKSRALDTQVGKDILAYIRASKHIEATKLVDKEDILRIINKPVRLISRQIIAEEGMCIEGLKKIYSTGEIKQNIDKLIFDLGIIKNATPFGAVMYIRNGIKYEEYLRNFAKDKGKSLKVLMMQLDTVQREAEGFRTIDDWLAHYEKNQMHLGSREKMGEAEKGISVLTMHGAKGLEFKVVFIIDANQGIVPSSKVIRTKDYEEERRVFYVAMTRAIETLHIFSIREYAGGDMETSMFVSEILENC